jgi:putative NADPH-quinone reductase
VALVIVDDRFPGVRDVAGAVAEGLGANWTVEVLQVGDRPAAMSAAERAAYETDHPALDPIVAEHGRLLADAGAIVVVHPTVANGLSAPVKGWLDRVLLPGVAFALDERTNRMRPALGHIRLLGGVTLDDRGPVERALFHDNGRRIVSRALRLVCGARTRVRWARIPIAADAEPSAADLARVARLTARW